MLSYLLLKHPEIQPVLPLSLLFGITLILAVIPFLLLQFPLLFPLQQILQLQLLLLLLFELIVNKSLLLPLHPLLEIVSKFPSSEFPQVLLIVSN